MKILIAGGTGFIGKALITDRCLRGDQVAVISRHNNNDVLTYNWSEITARIINDYDVIINLAGENIGKKRWTIKQKQKILSSRIETTSLLADLCAQLGDQAPILLNASAIGVYGLQQTEVDENTCIDKPTDFLSLVGQTWEKATDSAKQAGVSVVNMRFGVVLGASGGVLKQLYWPYILGLGGKIGAGEQMFTWISLVDLIRAIDYVISHQQLLGAINFVAPNAVKQCDFAKQYANYLHRPCWLSTPAWLLKLLLGEMAEALLLTGQQVLPTVLLEASFKFTHASLSDLLTAEPVLQ